MHGSTTISRIAAFVGLLRALWRSPETVAVVESGRERDDDERHEGAHDQHDDWPHGLGEGDHVERFARSICATDSLMLAL